MGEQFQKGDYVVFTARAYSDVRCGCTSEMENTLYGKIFIVDSIKETGFGQFVYISVCDLTDNPNECSLDWNFSPDMFELYSYEEEVDAAPKMTFDDFLSEAQNA